MGCVHSYFATTTRKSQEAVRERERERGKHRSVSRDSTGQAGCLAYLGWSGLVPINAFLTSPAAPGREVHRTADGFRLER